MRLIDADALTDIINRYTINTNPNNFNLDDKISYGIWMFHNGENAAFTNACMAIENAQTFDAAPVINCCDCHWHKNCDIEHKVGGYCGMGERRAPKHE